MTVYFVKVAVRYNRYTLENSVAKNGLHFY